MTIITLITLIAAIGTGADEVVADFPKQVKRLVLQLNSDELAERNAAEQQLVELGPAVLDVLDKFGPIADAEIKVRLARVREALYKQAVEAATKAATVTLQAKEMPLSEIFSAIEKQTGNRIVDKRKAFGQRVEELTMDVDFSKTPFWQALDYVLDEAELTTYHYSGEEQAIAVVARQLGTLPRSDRSANSGVFRFEPTQVEAIRDLRFPVNQVLKLYLEISWEPRLVPIAISQSVAALTVRDEKGATIEADGRAGTITADVNSSSSATEFEMQLVLPSRDVEKIASLEGELSVLVPGRVESFSFDDLDQIKNVQQKKASATVIVQAVRKNGSIHEVRMVLRFDKAANALESHRNWVLGNDAYLIDRDGKRVDHAGFESTLRTQNEAGYAYKFAIDDDVASYRFVYHTPAAIVQKKIPYTLKNIPLP